MAQPLCKSAHSRHLQSPLPFTVYDTEVILVPVPKDGGQVAPSGPQNDLTTGAVVPVQSGTRGAARSRRGRPPKILMTDPRQIIKEVKSGIRTEIGKMNLTEGAKGNMKKNFNDSLCRIALSVPNEIFLNGSIVRKSLWN